MYMWVAAYRREALPVWSTWLRAVLRGVFQSTKAYAGTLWWVRPSFQLHVQLSAPLFWLYICRIWSRCFSLGRSQDPVCVRQVRSPITVGFVGRHSLSQAAEMSTWGSDTERTVSAVKAEKQVSLSTVFSHIHTRCGRWLQTFLDYVGYFFLNVHSLFTVYLGTFSKLLMNFST